MPIPNCLNPKGDHANKPEVIQRILQLAAENPTMSFADFRDLIQKTFGFSLSTTYAYLREAKKILLEQDAHGREGKPPLARNTTIPPGEGDQV